MSPPRYMPQRTKNRFSNKRTYTHVHTGPSHNSHKVETAQIPIKGRLNGQGAAYAYHEMILRHGKNEVLIRVTTGTEPVVRALCSLREARHKMGCMLSFI